MNKKTGTEKEEEEERKKKREKRGIGQQKKNAHVL